MRLHRTRSTIALCALLAALFWTMTGASFALADPGGDNVASAIATALPLAVTGSLDSTSSDVRDVYAISLTKGQTLDASLVATAGTDFDLVLYKGITSIDETTTRAMTWSGGVSSTEHFTFMAAYTGTYYLDVHAFRGASTYTLNARIIPTVKFKLGGLKVPKSAKKGRSVKVSVVLTPAYNGAYTPVLFEFYRYEKKHWKRKAFKAGQGTRNPGGPRSTLSTTYKFPKKGKWRVYAVFWDAAHPKGAFTYKRITIK